MSAVGISGPVIFDGVPLLRDARELQVTDRWPQNTKTLAGGARRLFVPPSIGGAPLARPRRDVELSWDTAAEWAPFLRAALAVPVVHTLVLFKPVYLAWRSDGSRLVFELPWSLAAHLPEIPAGADAANRLATTPALLAGESDLTVVDVEPGVWASSDLPPAGAAWLERGGRRFRLGTAPALGATIYGAFVPVHLVVADLVQDERRYTGPIREPQRVRLMEI